MNTMTSLGDSEKDEGLVSSYTVFFTGKKSSWEIQNGDALCVYMFNV